MEVVFQMLENYRQCGFLYMEEYRQAHWGTRYNAHNTLVDLTGMGCRFISQYAPPIKVLAALSKRHSGKQIIFRYAEDDVIYGPCGWATLQDGEITSSDTYRPGEDLAKWQEFARRILKRRVF